VPTDADEIRTAVRERYSRAATSSSCCTPVEDSSGLFGQAAYRAEEAAVVPGGALVASLGCGNPTMLADLQPGDVVLDLGSGGGIDVFLSARRVGPTGKAYGLDMTPEMLELARRHQAEAGVTNVEFLLGTIEDVPLPDGSVDVIISNCVVNLSPDKDAVFREAFRVLTPGGRFAVSDIVLRRPLPEPLRHQIGLWTGCVAGALLEDEYRVKLRRAGFTDVDIEAVQVYDRADLMAIATDPAASLDIPASIDRDATADALDGAVMSAFVRARTPVS
jgi:SAM-dependent methyltransferase